MELKNSGPLPWVHRTGEVHASGLRRTQEASVEDRLRLSQELDLLGCTELLVEYLIEPSSSGAWILSGNLNARITQSCVVSLEPVEAYLSEQFCVHFLIGKQDDDFDPDENSILNTNDVEILQNDRIEVGRIIYETLSSALNPYPRKVGAEFSWSTPHSNLSSSSANPFLVLKKLKPDA